MIWNRIRTPPKAPSASEEALEEARARLVAEVAAEARETSAYLGKDALDPRVLEALRRVPRHEFVPASERGRAYWNAALPIGAGQTISQPFVVAAMTDALGVGPRDTVLEIGTGSGYQAAVLAEIAARVYTVEIVREHAEAAAERLARLGYDNVHVRVGDGADGWPEHAPYDGIIVTAATPEVPPPLIEQLAPGRRLVLPLGRPGDTQILTVVEKAADGTTTSRGFLPVAFVPLTGLSARRK